MVIIRQDTNGGTTPSPCLANDPDCDFTRYLIVLVVFLIALAVMMCICKSAFRIFFGACRGEQRQATRTTTDTDIIYPRNDRNPVGHQNFGFVDPPPRYDQIFKRGGGTPAIITTREAPSSTNSSAADLVQPPSYEQVEIQRMAAGITTVSGTMRETPLQSVDMEHPSMVSSRASTIVDMEAHMANIHNHAHACAQRYDSNHARSMIAAITTPEPVTTDTSDNLEAPEGGPPGYDAISLTNENTIHSIV